MFHIFNPAGIALTAFLFSMLGVFAIIYVVIIVPVEYFINKPTHVDIKTR